jgi:hypothetical protein
MIKICSTSTGHASLSMGLSVPGVSTTEKDTGDRFPGMRTAERRILNARQSRQAIQESS